MHDRAHISVVPYSWESRSFRSDCLGIIPAHQPLSLHPSETATSKPQVSVWLLFYVNRIGISLKENGGKYRVYISNLHQHATLLSGILFL